MYKNNEKYFKIDISNAIKTSQKKSSDRVDLIYLKSNGETIEAVYVQDTPTSIKTEKLEVKDSNEGCYNHKVQRLEKIISNSK